MKGITDLTKEEVNFETKDIKYFGVEVYESKTKKGKFSSFKKRNYIKTTQKIYVDYKIAEIRKWFNKVELINKKEHFKRKGEKTVKSISKVYEVIKEGVIFLPKPIFENLLLCNSKHVLFEYKKVIYYFIIDFIYRNTTTEDYLYINKEDETLEKTGFNLLENRPTKYDILEWTKNR